MHFEVCKIVSTLLCFHVFAFLSQLWIALWNIVWDNCWAAVSAPEGARRVSITWKENVKHLPVMRFAWKNNDGTYTWPCEEHDTFLFAAANKYIRTLTSNQSKTPCFTETLHWTIHMQISPNTQIWRAKHRRKKAFSHFNVDSTFECICIHAHIIFMSFIQGYVISISKYG